MKNLAFMLALSALFSVGCGRPATRTYDCPYPDLVAVDEFGHPDPCHRAIPTPKPEVCQGECITMGTAGFRREPLLLWYGEDTAPACPDHAKNEFWNGYDGLIAGPECPLCTCGTSFCELPVGIAAMSDTICQGNLVASLEAPPGWDGSCISPAIATPGTFGAVAVAPPTAAACEAVAVPLPPNAGSDFKWTTKARACDGLVNGICTSSDEMCSPTAKPPPPGFHQCIWYEKDVDEADLPVCPDAYPEQKIFYEDVDDNRECTPCECGQPLGNKCVAAVSGYQDMTCGSNGFPLFENVAVGLGQAPGCITTMPGGGLASTSASWAQNEPGACVASGGMPYGEATPSKPGLFCCKP